MRLKVEYSQIVRKKMKALKNYLSDSFGDDVAKKGIKSITDSYILIIIICFTMSRPIG